MQLQALSVATFNLLNLNLPSLPLYGKPGWTPEQYEQKVNWSAAQLKLLRPDVLGVQELWHQQCLTDVLAASGLADEYDAVAPPEAQGGQIHCAALIRKDLLQGAPEWISTFPAETSLQSGGNDSQSAAITVNISTFHRPVLHFSILPRTDEPAIEVFVAHLKSKNPERPVGEHQGARGSALATIRRTAEACALRILLTKTMKQNTNPVILLGDINDGMLSNTANILTEQPTYLSGETLGGSDTALYTTQSLQEFRDTRDVYYTHVFKGMRESLDHILVSEEFYDHSKKRRWFFKDLIVSNDHLDFDENEVGGANDHGIVRARFKYKPAKSSA